MKLNVIYRFMWFIFCVLFINSEIFADSKTPDKKSVCLNMIVKNEAGIIERCLKSVKPHIDYWVIVDTGSTDGTQKVIKEFMKGIPGKLYERPWVNFAHNRNEAMKYAKNCGDYLLFIDADEELITDKDFQMPKLEKDMYYITTDFAGTSYERVQLINNHMQWKWVGVLHEYLDCPNIQTRGVLQGLTNLVRTEGDRSKDPKKFDKDAQLLEAALKDDPNNTRNVFYLAQSYRDAGKWELAKKNYQRRVEMGGWVEEIFWSKYQIAYLDEVLEAPPEVVIKSYCDAYTYRPSRAEPLCRLSSYLRGQGNYFMAYLVACHGLKIPMPKEDILFIENWAYDYGILMEKSVAAYWIEKYDEALLDSHEMLSKPNLPQEYKTCVEENLKWINKKFVALRK